MNFVFYDTETTGTHKAFDQILQFAAILTDESLVELERFEIRCRLLPHIVASPGALKVTGVTINQITDPDTCSHYEMMCQIQQKLTEWSPAIFIGHNALDFDEHFLRQAFYQTLHPLYLTSMSGSCRADTLDMLRAADLFDEGKITIPVNAKGKKAFKLDQLAPANGFQHENAHDALADVEATIYMCNLIRERVPAIWDMAMRCSKKAAVEQYVQEQKLFCLTEHYYGKPYTWPVTYLGLNPERLAENLLFNLEIDPELEAMTDGALIERLAQSPKPIRSCKSNGFPVLMSLDCYKKTADRDALEARANYLHGNGDLKERLISLYLGMREPFPDSVHIKEQLYSAFTSDAEGRLLKDFHNLPWADRPTVLERLADERLKALGYRLLYHEAPHVMSATILQDHHRVFARRLLNPCEKNTWLNISAALLELEAILPTCNEAQHAAMTAYGVYLRNKAAELSVWLEKPEDALSA